MSLLNDKPKGFTPTNKSASNQAFGELAVVKQLQSPVFTSSIIKTIPSGTGLTPDRIIKPALALLQTKPDLRNCPPNTIIDSVRRCAYLGLEPDPSMGQVWFVPYKNVCSLQIGYRGMLELAFRSGAIKKLQPVIVYKNDLFDLEMGMDAKITHKPTLSMLNRGENNIMGVYVCIVLGTGERYFDFMLKEEIDLIRANSPSKNSDAWAKHYEEMAKKTVIRRSFKYLPISLNANPHVARLKHAVMYDEYADAGEEVALPLEIEGEFSINESQTPIDENTEFLNKLNVKNG